MSTRDHRLGARSFALFCLWPLLLLLASSALAATWQRNPALPAGDYPFLALAVDSLGTAHATYWDPATSSVRYGFWDGDTWSFETIESTGPFNAGGTSLAIDASGRPHAAWSADNPSLPGSGAVLRHGVRDGGVWSVETVDVDGTDVGRLSALALRGEDVAIAYQANGTVLRCALWRDGAWAVGEVAPGALFDLSGQRVTVAIAPGGSLHIAYFFDTPDSSGLCYANDLGLGWSQRIVEPWPYGHWPSLALDPAGRPHFAHAWLLGQDWSACYTDLVGGVPFTTVVDDTGQTGAWIGHRMDRWGNPHLAYRRIDTGKARVRYARRCGSEWQVETADSLVEADGDLTLDVSRQGRVHLLYPRTWGGEILHTYTAPLDPQDTRLFVSPGGQGFPFRVVALDEGGSPMPGAEIEVEFGACPEVQLCRQDSTEDYGFARGRYIVRGFADCFGERWFHVRGGGNDASDCATISVNGTAILQRRVVSPDFDGDLDVDADDEGSFLNCYYAGSSPMCDLNGDDLVSVSDFSLFQAYYGTACLSAVGVGPIESGPGTRLRPAVPNPTPGACALALELSIAARVRVEVVDLAGRRVRSLAPARALAAGTHRWTWDGRDDAGHTAPAGVYRVCVQADGVTRQVPVVLLR